MGLFSKMAFVVGMAHILFCGWVEMTGNEVNLILLIMGMGWFILSNWFRINDLKDELKNIRYKA